ncbi:MAG: hypothetical protein KKE17_09040 [Proteobacteria bacterium]|nr:hypothetical protein [Pseudomonadota bacterium]MBU1710133.1 hypothetical protein [Pseudomonadota bacterium]
MYYKKRIFLFFYFFLIVSPVSHSLAAEFIASTLVDHGDVIVMEVEGDYDANLPDGQSNALPRQEIAKEFIATHQDDYDFLVIISNFDFLMPQDEAIAFYHEVKNDVQGIGKDLFNNSTFYGSNGVLQGTIDMGNIQSIGVDPLDPGFSETMGTLSHELLHRWAAEVTYRKPDNTISIDLLGKGGSHWNFLLDTAGSLEYGNRWINNGNGTFTSLAGRKYFSPLDLYLMGFIDKSEVPPMLLIDNAGIDHERLPEPGVTIEGAAQYVSIDDIIAAEGERIPGVTDSQKTFRIGCIFVTRPGTYSENDLYGIRNIMQNWTMWFSGLTNGVGKIEIDTAPFTNLPENPGPETLLFDPRTAAPEINDGVAWLMNNQDVNGSWQDGFYTAERDTSDTLIALSDFTNTTQSSDKGIAWLQGIETTNLDYLARKIQVLSRSGLDVSQLHTALLARQNQDGGWGSNINYISNPTDTSLALLALATIGNTNIEVINPAIEYLKGQQNTDAGWGADGTSNIFTSVNVITAFSSYQQDYELDGFIQNGLVWIYSKQNIDGGFGNSPSTVYNTATTLIGLKQFGISSDVTDRALNYILERQSQDGSWYASAHQTSKAVNAMWVAMRDPDLVVSTSDIIPSPENITSLPTQVDLSVTVHNNGMTDVADAQVILYENTISEENKLGEQFVAVISQSSATVVFNTTINDGNSHRYFAVVDPDNLIKEASENNNIALRMLYPEPTYDFEILASDLTVTPETANYFQDVVIHNLISNHGTLDSYNVPIKYYLDLPSGAVEIVLEYIDVPSGQTIDHEYIWKADVVGEGMPLNLQIDPENAFAELSEANNQSNKLITVNSAIDPNLTLSYLDIVADPTPASEKGTTTLSAKIENNGFAPAENVEVQFHLGDPQMGGELLGASTIPLIPINGSETASHVWTDIPVSGEKVISVVVDPDSNINEISETDNSAFNTLKILTLPDLTLSIRSISFSPDAPKEGDILTIEVLVQNAGEQDSSSVTVVISENGNQIGEETLAFVEGNSQGSVFFTYDTIGKTGLHTVTAQVDPSDTILEQDNENNTASRNFGVQDSNLWLTEQYISPNGDGIQDSTDFTFRLESPQTVEIVIVNEYGEAVRTFSGSEFENVAAGAISWDGLDDFGRVVEDGQYQIQIRSEDSILSSLVIVVDNNKLLWSTTAGTDYILQRSTNTPKNAVWLPDESGFIYSNISSLLACRYGVKSPLCGLFYYSIDGATKVRLTKEEWYNDYNSNYSYHYEYVNDSECDNVFFKISDDSKKVAFIILKYNKLITQWEYQLWSVNTNGGELHLVESLNTESYRGVYWSPDSAYLAYKIYDTVTSGYKIIISKPDGSEKVEIIPNWSNSTGSYQSFRWSPDGKKIAYASETHLVVSDINGQQENIFPVQSPSHTIIEWFDENQILLRDYNLGLSGNLFNIWVIDTTFQQQPLMVAENAYLFALDLSLLGCNRWGGGGSGYTDNYISLSPDKNHFAYLKSPSDHTIVVCDKTGVCKTAVEEMDNFYENSYNFSWSPNGKKFFGSNWTAGYFFTYDIDSDQVDFFPTENWWITCLRPHIPSQDELPSNYKVWPYPEEFCNNVYDDIELEPDYWLSDNIISIWNKKFIKYNQSPIYHESILNITNGSTSYFPIGGNVSPQQNYIFKPGIVASSLLPLTTELQVTKDDFAVILKGIASDLNFSGWTLEYANQQTPNDWHLITPPSEKPVIDDVFAEWVPPCEGTFYVKLTATDKAGNTKWTRKRVSWGKKFAITNLYKSGELFSPNNDGVNDTVSLHFTINEPVHLEFNLLDNENNLLRTFPGDFAVPGPYSIVWDGMDDQGNVVLDGIYKIKILNYEFYFQVDNTLPEIKLEFSEITNRISVSLDALVLDENLKVWTIEYGEGINPSEWYSLKNGENEVWAKDDKNDLIYDGEGNLVPGEVFSFSENDLEFPINKRFRIVAEDYAGNSNTFDVIFGEEIFVLRRWDDAFISLNRTATGNFQSTNLLEAEYVQAEIHTLKLVETILPQFASMTIQYRTNNTWYDDTTITEIALTNPEIEWDASSFEIHEIQGVRVYAEDATGREFYSNNAYFTPEVFSISFCHKPLSMQDLIYTSISLYEDLAFQKIQMQSNGDPDFVEWTDVWVKDAASGVSSQIGAPPLSDFLQDVNYNLRMIGITPSGEEYISNSENYPPVDCPDSQPEEDPVKKGRLELDISQDESLECNSITSNATISVLSSGAISSYPKTVTYVIENTGEPQLLRSFDFATHRWGKLEVDTSIMAEGVYPVSATLGYESSTDVYTDNLVVDRALPLSRITYPDSSSEICPRRIDNQDGSWYGIDIEGIATDNNEVQRYEIFYGIGANPTQWLPAKTQSGCGENQQCNISVEIAKQGLLGTWDVSNLSESLYTLKLKVVDQSGNVSCSFATVIFDKIVNVDASIDNYLISPNGDDIFEEVSLSYHIDEVSTLDAKVYGPFDSKEKANTQSSLIRTVVEGVTQLAGDGDFVWDGKDNTGGGVSDGWYAFALFATDSCGNVNQKTFLIEVDNSPPITTITSPLSTIIQDLAVDVTGTAADEHFLKYRLVALNSNNHSELYILAESDIPAEDKTLGLWNTFGLSEGQWDLKLYATDLAGNSSDATVTVNLEPRPDLLKTFLVDPEIFSPNSDGNLENGQIQYELTDICDLTINILDSNKTLIKSTTFSAHLPGFHTYHWDGTANSSAPVPDGTYGIDIIAALTSNNSIVQNESITVEIDTIPPIIEILSPLNDTHLKESLNVSGTVNDANLETYSMTYSSSQETVTFASENRVRENHTFAILNDLHEGSYILHVAAVDAAQNSFARDIQFTVDNTPPAFDFVTPLNGELYGFGKEVIEIKGTITEENFSGYTLRSGVGEEPIEWTLLVSEENLPSNEELYQWDVGQNSNISDNSYTLSLVAIDKAGWEIEKRASVIVDNTVPIVAITYPLEGGYFRENGAILGTASDQNISEYKVELSGGECLSAYQWIILKREAVSVIDGDLASINALPADGTYCLRATALDTIGNNAVVTRTFHVDTIPPAPPVLNGHLIEDQDTLLSWTHENVSDVAGYNLYRNGQRVNNDLLTDQNYTDYNLSEGGFSYEVTAVDAAGSESNFSNAIKIVIDNTGPDVNITSPENGATVSDLVDIRGTSSSSDDFKEYRISVRSGANPSEWQLIRESPVPIRSNTLYQWDTIGLSDNVYSLKLEAEDLHDNISSKIVIVTIDNTPPAAPVLISAVPSGDSVDLSWQANNEDDLAGYLLYRNHQLANVSGFTYGDLKPYLISGTMYTETEVPDGVHHYYLIAMDQAGNTSDQSIILEVDLDNRAPQARIKVPTSGIVFQEPIILTADSEDSDIATIQFQYRKSNEAIWTDLGSPVTSPFVVTFDPATLLLDYNDYLLRSVATDVGGRTDNQPQEIVVTYTDLTPPSAPSGLQAKVVSGIVTLSWSGNTELDLAGFNVYHQSSKLNSQIILDEFYDYPQYSSGLSGGDYSFHVAAVDIYGNESEMSPLSVNVPGAILQQQPRVVTEQNITLEGMTQPLLNVEVFHDTQTGVVSLGSVSASQEGNFIVDAILISGDNSFYSVATDSKGNTSKPSNIIIVSYSEPPSPPTGLYVDVSEFDVHVAWDPNQESNIHGYNLYRDGIKINEIQPLDIPNENLTASGNAQYAYRVFDSNIQSAWYDCGINLSSPGWLEVQFTSEIQISDIGIDWKDEFYSGRDFEIQAWIEGTWQSAAIFTGNQEIKISSNFYPPIKTDKIRVNITSTNNPESGSCAMLSELSILQEAHIIENVYNDIGLGDGEYHYQVSAVNVYELESILSEPVSIVVGDIVPPAPPSNLIATVSGNDVSVSWDENLETDLAGYNFYKLVNAEWIKINTLLLTQQAYQEFELINATYSYRVTAVDNTGNESESSMEVSAVVNIIPPASPTNLHISAPVDGGRLELCWNASIEPFEGYALYRSIISGSSYNRVNEGLIQETCYIDDELINGTQYYYIVVSVDQFGNESTQSNEASSTPQDLEYPMVPQIIEPTQSGYSITTDSDNITISGKTESNAIVSLFNNEEFISETIASASDNIKNTYRYGINGKIDVSHTDGILAYNYSNSRILFYGLAEYHSSILLKSTVSYITWSDPGDMLAYVYQNGGYFRIGIYNFITKTDSNLTECSDCAEVFPSWSGDSIVAYISKKNGSNDLWMKNFETGGISQLTNGYSIDFAEIAPDGSKVAFFEGQTLSVIDPETFEITLIDSLIHRSGEIPSLGWNPDSSSIAFTSSRNGVVDIYVYDFSLGQVYQVTDTDQNELELSWSDSGKDLAYIKEIQANSWEVRIVSVEDMNKDHIVEAIKNNKPSNLIWRPSVLHYLSGPYVKTVHFAGTFTFENVPLNAGENVFTATAMDDGGNVSDPSDEIVVYLDPSFLPDLEVFDDDIFIFPVAPLAGQETVISVPIRNPGSFDLENVDTSIYILDATGRMELVKTATIPSLISGSEEWLSFTWDTTGNVGRNTIYVTVDPQDVFNEASETNNNANKDFYVVEEHGIAMSVMLDSDQYRSYDYLSVIIDLFNSGLDQDVTLDITIEDENSYLVENFDSLYATLTYGVVDNYILYWNTTDIFAGNYQLRANLKDSASITIKETIIPFVILPELVIEAAVSTAKIHFGPEEDVSVNITVANNSLNSLVAGLDVQMTIKDSEGTEVGLNYFDNLALLSDTNVSLKSSWNTGLVAPGDYLIELTCLLNNEIVAQDSSAFVIDTVSELSGAVTIDPEVVTFGNGATAHYTITNTGNASAGAVELNILLLDSLTSTIIATAVESVDLILGDTLTGNVTFPADLLSLGNYTILMQAYHEQTMLHIGDTIFTVKDLTAPIVEIISPVQASILNGIFDLEVKATDDASGVSGVEYRIDSRTWLPIPLTNQISGVYSLAYIPLAEDEGEHSIQFRGTDNAGNVSCAVSSLVTIELCNPFDELSGSVTIGPDPLYFGQDISFVYHINNGCTKDLQGLTVRLNINDPVTGSVAAFVSTVNVPSEGNYNGIFTFSSLDLNVQVYDVLLGVEIDGESGLKTLEISSLEVLPALEVTNGIADQSNVLVWLNRIITGNTFPAQCSDQVRIDLLNTMLSNGVDKYRIVCDKSEFEHELRNPFFTDILILGDQQPLTDHHIDELMDKVYSGTGLVSAGWLEHGTHFEGENLFLGINDKGTLAGSQHEIQLLDSPITTADVWAVNSYAWRVEIAANATVAGWILGNNSNNYPAIVLSDYGIGKTIFYAFDLSEAITDLNLAEFSDLLTLSLAYVHKVADQSIVKPYHMVPHALTTTSPGRGFDLSVAISYPPELRIYDTQTDTWVVENPWFFNLPVASGGTIVMPYSILLPDTLGTYTLSIENGFMDQDQYVPLQTDTYDIVLDQDRAALIDSIIGEVSSLQLSSQDSAKAADIIACLENVRANVIIDIGDLQVNIHEIEKAIDSLLRIESIDISDIRLQLDTLLRIEQGRYYFYE